MRRIIPRLVRLHLLAAILAATMLACGSRERPQSSALSPDEKYLVDTYVRVRRAGAHYPYQREIADSLLSRLEGEVDTVRVARTIASLNASPERWTIIFESIEKRLTEPSAASESTRT